MITTINNRQVAQTTAPKLRPQTSNAAGSGFQQLLSQALPSSASVRATKAQPLTRAILSPTQTGTSTKIGAKTQASAVVPTSTPTAASVSVAAPSTASIPTSTAAADAVALSPTVSTPVVKTQQPILGPFMSQAAYQAALTGTTATASAATQPAAATTQQAPAATATTAPATPAPQGQMVFTPADAAKAGLCMELEKAGMWNDSWEIKSVEEANFYPGGMFMNRYLQVKFNGQDVEKLNTDLCLRAPEVGVQDLRRAMSFPGRVS